MASIFTSVAQHAGAEIYSVVPIFFVIVNWSRMFELDWEATEGPRFVRIEFSGQFGEVGTKC